MKIVITEIHESDAWAGVASKLVGKSFYVRGETYSNTTIDGNFTMMRGHFLGETGIDDIDNHKDDVMFSAVKYTL